MKTVTGILVFLICSQSASGQIYDLDSTVNEFNKHSLGLSWANDGWFKLAPQLNSDDDFTNGITLSFGGTLSNFAIFNQLDSIFGNLYYQRSSKLIVSQQMFTPSDGRIQGLNPNDRPYVGYTFLGSHIFGKRINENDQIIRINWSEFQKNWCQMFVLNFDNLGISTENRNAVVFDAIGFNLGVLGDGGAAVAQAGVHHFLGIPQFSGWQSHISNKVTVQTAFSSTQRLRLAGLLDYDNSDAFHCFEVDARSIVEVGNAFIRFTQGYRFRAGWLQDEPISRNSEQFTSRMEPPLFFCPLFVDTNIIYNVYDATISTDDQTKYRIAAVPIVLNADYGTDIRVPVGKGAFLYLGLVWLETTTSTYLKYQSDGTIDFTNPIQPNFVVKVTAEYAF